MGHPLLFAMGPTKGDNSEWTNLNAIGLNNNNKINVVWRVNFHFKEELSAIFMDVWSVFVYISICIYLYIITFDGKPSKDCARGEVRTLDPRYIRPMR